MLLNATMNCEIKILILLISIHSQTSTKDVREFFSEIELKQKFSEIKGERKFCENEDLGEIL